MTQHGLPLGKLVRQFNAGLAKRSIASGQDTEKESTAGRRRGSLVYAAQSRSHNFQRIDLHTHSLIALELVKCAVRIDLCQTIGAGSGLPVEMRTTLERGIDFRVVAAPGAVLAVYSFTDPVMQTLFPGLALAGNRLAVVNT